MRRLGRSEAWRAQEANSLEDSSPSTEQLVRYSLWRVLRFPTQVARRGLLSVPACGSGYERLGSATDRAEGQRAHGQYTARPLAALCYRIEELPDGKGRDQ